MALRRPPTRAAAGSGTALVLVAVLLAGCSSQATAGAATAAAAPPSSSRATGNDGRCTTDRLAGSLVPGSPGAGQRYATLVLTNTGDRTCTVYGYGGVGLYASDGSALPTHQVRVRDPAPQTVLVPPGGTVSSLLHWSAVPGAGDTAPGNCQPVPAALRVIPPDETTALSVPWTQGPVCEGGTIDQQAYAG